MEGGWSTERRKQLMALVKDLFKVKGTEIWSVGPDTSVLDALQVMHEKDIGALLVQDSGGLVGIFSERDFARSIVDTGSCVINAPVKEYMTTKVYTIAPGNSIEDCMQLMTAKKIRHLPVMENDKLVGIISIGDVVKELIASKETTISTLENYIEGHGYGQ
jgi:CBS domain-containing protein